MTTRFVLRRRQPGGITPELEQEVARLPGVTVQDRSPRMLVVGGDEDTLQRFVQSREGWLLFPERTYRMGDPRPGPERPGQP